MRYLAVSTTLLLCVHGCSGSAPPVPPAARDGLIALTRTDATGRLQIFTITSSGANATQLTLDGENGRPDWSPDGTQIAYMSIQASRVWVAVMNADGSDPRRLAEGGTPDWSPDGTQIAFARPVGPDIEIWTMAPDGSAQVQITSSGTSKVGPSWSPDGTQM